MPIKVEREPSGEPFCELCVSCNKRTKFWADDGHIPCCEACAEKLTLKKARQLCKEAWDKALEDMKRRRRNAGL